MFFFYVLISGRTVSLRCKLVKLVHRRFHGKQFSPKVAQAQAGLIHPFWLSLRCAASRAVEHASAPPPRHAAPSAFHWCPTPAGVARCVPGRRARPAASACPATPSKGCSATTAPASPEDRDCVSVRTQHTTPAENTFVYTNQTLFLTIYTVQRGCNSDY